MSHGTSETVECPLCGEAFDPTAAGGWCTNSDCGEWQYETTGEAADRETEGDGAHGETAADDVAEEVDDALSDREEIPDAESDDPDRSAAVDGVSSESDADGQVGDEPEPDDGQADSSVDAADEDEPAETSEATETSETAGADEATETDEVAEADEAEGEDQSEAGGVAGADEAELSCPGCGEAVAADDNFCATCGEDVSSLEAGPLTACPACDADIEPEDSFCANCGEDLDAHRSGGAESDANADREANAGSAVDADTDAGSDAQVDAADRGADAADRGADTAAETGDSDGSDADGPESLVLVVRNREVQVWDGDTVGRTIRSIVTDTGGDEDDALSIHREHVQFVREDGRFNLVAMGRNPTVVNGRSLDEGERVPVSPGDRIELSGVVTMRVQTP